MYVYMYVYTHVYCRSVEKLHKSEDTFDIYKCTTCQMYNSFSEHDGNQVAGIFGKHSSVHPDALAHKDSHLEVDRSFQEDLKLKTPVLTPKGVLAKALQYINTSTKSRFKQAQKDFDEEEQRVRDIEPVLLYVAAEDLTLLQEMSKSALLEAIVRREAWRTRPIIMSGIVLAQILLCVVAMLSSNEPVNTSTTVMTIIFLVITAATNPFQVNRDLIKFILKRGSPVVDKLGTNGTIAVLIVASPFWIPVAVLVLTCTFVFDLMVGRIEDNSFSGLANVMVNTIVISTALSVGIRSGDPINAIQTFAGFEFISRMDEALMQHMKFDPYCDYHMPSRPEAKLKKMHVRVILYIFVPVVTIFTTYITFANSCISFCSNDQGGILDQSYT